MVVVVVDEFEFEFGVDVWLLFLLRLSSKVEEVCEFAVDDEEDD